MGETGLVQIISFAAVASFAATFVLIATHSPALRFVRWFAAAFLIGGSIQLLSFLVPVSDSFGYTGFLRATLLLLVATCGLVGTLLCFDKRPPWRILIMAVCLVPVISFLTVFLDVSATLRSAAFTLPQATLYGISGIVFLRGKSRQPLDRLIGVSLVAISINVLSRTLAVALTTGWGAQDQIAFFADYEVYWKFASAIFGVMLGAAMVTRFLRDIVSYSRIDALSGLLNRGAFEEKAGQRLRDIQRTRTHACMVVADLDRFKQINDCYGHAAGDEVIASFAEIIRQCDTGDIIAGRLGGEEFGIFLEGANLAIAELFAESIRLAFSITPYKGVPAGVHFTASLGVAQMQPNQSLAELMRSADGALYEAKAAGRDQVRLAPSVSLVRTAGLPKAS